MKFLVVDDHALVREGLRHALATLSADVTVLEASSAAEAYGLAAQHSDIDLVLLDLRLPDTDGLSAMQELHRRRGSLPVAILSGSRDTTDMVTTIRSGAVGFIPKSSTREVMLQALRLILSGGVYIPPQALGLEAATQPTEAPHPAAQCADVPRLTRRETEILTLLAQGKPNKIIASELNISEATVKAHVTEILRALKVTNRSQAGIAARRLGIC